MEGLILYETPELHRPCLVAGFSGWPNAAEVSTGVATYFKTKLGATKFAHISPDEFYDFSTLRPLVTIEAGLIKGVEFVDCELFYWKGESAHDLVLLIGAEPHLRWHRFGQLILDVAQQVGVVRVYALGGIYDATPHTAEPRVSGLVNEARLLTELVAHDIEPATYMGPVSFHGPLLDMCRERNIEGISLWGRAPHYIPIHNPKVISAVVSRLARMLEIDIDISELREAAQGLDRRVQIAISQNPKLEEYVRALEESYKQAGEQAVLPTEGTNEIIRAVEDFLRGYKRDGELDAEDDIL